MSVGQDLAEIAAQLALFADLTPPQLMAASHEFDELWFNQGQRILREGFSQPDFFVIIEGEAAAIVDGEEQVRLTKGDFFGEISVLLGVPPSSDIVATTGLRCMSLSGDRVQAFLKKFPDVMYRMLQAEARKLRSAIQWRA